MRAKLLWLALLAAPAFADEVTVTGRVLDGDGKPTAGSDVGTPWLFGTEMRPLKGTTTDKDGAFSLKLTWYAGSLTLFAADGPRKNGATVVLQDPAKPVEIRLLPLLKVTGHLSMDPKDLFPPVVNILWGLKGLKQNFGTMTGRTREFTALVPAGEYSVTVGNPDLETGSQDVTVAAGDKQDLGEFALRLGPLAACYGKPPPAISVRDARGLAKTVQPADLKGKWVLIEFWAWS